MTEALHEWHDFYLLLGTASATLVGLMFVAASIGASYFTPEREAGLRAFITPTVLHFTAVLIACLVAMVPTHDEASLGILLLIGAAVGLVYSCRVWLNMRRGGLNASIDLADRAWYMLSPVTSYLLIAAAGVLFLLRSHAAPEVLAAALVILLLLGIRNAWDMTVWVMLRAPTTK